MDTTDQPKTVKIEFRQTITENVVLTKEEFMDLWSGGYETHNLTGQEIDQLRAELSLAFEKLTKRKTHLIVQRDPYDEGNKVYSDVEENVATEVRRKVYSEFGILADLLRRFFGHNWWRGPLWARW